MPYFLGMDVGGTKTYALAADEGGTILGFGKAGCGSYEYHGIEAAASENQAAVSVALEESKLVLADISAVGLGVAGADLAEDFEMLEREIYTPLFGAIPRRFKNDSMAALRGGTRADYGIVIVCGTGSVCAGRNRSGEESRVGGLGPEFGDRCTGAGIGEEGLRTVWRARDGIEAPTLLTQKFVERSGLAGVDELFRAVYRRTLPAGALEPMAKLVFEAAVEGDGAARTILQEGGAYLAAMINAVAVKLRINGERFDVVMAGSVFKGESPELVDALKAGIRDRCPHAACRRPAFDPVVGALLMAFEEAGALSEKVYEGLEASLPLVERRYGIALRAS